VLLRRGGAPVAYVPVRQGPDAQTARRRRRSRVRGARNRASILAAGATFPVELMSGDQHIVLRTSSLQLQTSPVNMG
jgi:hypothetical protein